MALWCFEAVDLCVALSLIISVTMASATLKGKPNLKPLPHGNRLLITQKLRQNIREIQLCTAQVLGFHTANVASKFREALSTIIQKLSALQHNFNVLDEIKRDVSALYNELKSIQAQLRLKGESADLLLLEKSSLIEKMAELTVEFEDDSSYSNDDSSDSKDDSSDSKDDSSDSKDDFGDLKVSSMENQDVLDDKVSSITVLNVFLLIN